MRRPFNFTLIFSCLLTVGLLGGFVTSVSAESEDNVRPRISSTITLTKPDDVSLGEPFTLIGIIKDQYGKPVVNKAIFFSIDTEYLGQARSNEKGIFQRKFNNSLDAGAYDISATYKGTVYVRGTTTSTTLNILPSEIKIQTVPPISGVTFQMDGQQFVSGEDGSGKIEINKSGLYRLDVLLDKYHNPSQRIEFGRWSEESYEPFRDIRVPNNGVIQVGLNVYHQVEQKFVDLEGNPVDPQRIEKVSIKSAQGDVFEYPDGQPRWIPASRIARRVTGLEETKLLYSVTNVTIDGSNVVNQSQQRFYTHPNESWEISLLLYPLHISAKDGLFGSAVGKSVNVEFPNGKIVNYPLNQAGITDIYSLARGNYFIELAGANGLNNRLPVALSRKQEVNIKVITYLDLTVFGMVTLFIALGLLLYGRPWLIRFLMKNKKNNVKEKVQEEVVIPGTLDHETNVEITNPTVNNDVYLKYESVAMFTDENFEKSTGVSRDFFKKMLAFLQNELPKVGKPPKLSLPDQLLLTLFYLREPNNESNLAHTYGVSEATVRRTFQKIESALNKSEKFHLPIKDTHQQPRDMATEEVLIDATKQTEEPPKNNVENTKPGKRHKRHKKNGKS